MANVQSENESKKIYPPDELQPDAEGRYHWTYEMIGSENPSYRNTLMLIFALIILIPGFILFFMIYGRNPGSGNPGLYLLIWFGILAAAELLTVLLCKVSEKVQGGSKSIPYEMDETGISLYPENRRVPQPYLFTAYKDVKDIQVKPQYDEIDLLELMRITQIYVYPEDRAFVLNYLFDHLPQTEKILKRKEQYGIYLEKGIREKGTGNR
ncbi:MAG: hypothetical protein IJI07_09060 [Flexilinea sp.]|nr:hypothetical protein [Flexilinea sp.]